MHQGDFSLFFQPVYVVRGCLRGVFTWRETPSAPSGLVPLQGAIRMENKTAIMAAAWRTKRPLWPPHGEQNGHYGRHMENKTGNMAATWRTKRAIWPPHGEQNGQYGRRMENRRGVTSRAEFSKSPLNFYCPYKSSTARVELQIPRNRKRGRRFTSTSPTLNEPIKKYDKTYFTITFMAFFEPSLILFTRM